MKLVLTTRTKIAGARLIQGPIVGVLRFMSSTSVVQARRGGVNWELDLDEGIDFSIWLLGAFERETVRAYSRLIGEGMVVLDIGANIGAHTLPLARRVGASGRVIAFEPTDWAMAKLKRNISLNPDLATRIVCRQTMLVDSDTRALPAALPASWPLDGGSDVHPKLRGRDKSTRFADAATLDSCIRDLSLTRIDFIKLDVDGHETMALRGAVETLSRFRPDIITELSPYILSERGSSLEEFISLLNGLGYRIFDLADEAPVPRRADAVADMIPDGGGINVLCKIERR